MCIAKVFWKSGKGYGMLKLDNGEKAFVRREMMHGYDESDEVYADCEQGLAGLVVSKMTKMTKSDIKSPQA
jgi:hypothetical protein